MTARTMPFGKHKGVPLTEIDTTYLEWVASLEDVRTPWLPQAVAEELNNRLKESDDAPTMSQADRLRLVRSILAKGVSAMPEEPEAPNVARWLSDLARGAS